MINPDPCKVCGTSTCNVDRHLSSIEPTPEKLDNELIATMYQIRIEYEAMKERMNHFEAWFVNAFDRIGAMEKQVSGLQQQMKIWFDGRGGMS